MCFLDGCLYGCKIPAVFFLTKIGDVSRYLPCLMFLSCCVICTTISMFFSIFSRVFIESIYKFAETNFACQKLIEAHACHI